MVNFMTNNNTENATVVALQETGTGSSNGAKTLSGGDKSACRGFGVVDLWYMRRNARMFRIHNRIPRL